jgi:hypothetical protein
MTRGWVSFKTVKQAVSMEMALATYGVMLHRLDRCYLRGRCPLPSHRSRSSAPSFIVNAEKNAIAACLADLRPLTNGHAANGGHPIRQLPRESSDPGRRTPGAYLRPSDRP